MVNGSDPYSSCCVSRALRPCEDASETYFCGHIDRYNNSGQNRNSAEPLEKMLELVVTDGE